MSRQPTIIDVAFTSVMLELGRLRNDLDFPEWCRQIRTVDTALIRLCDAIDDPRPGDPPAERLARDAYMAVLSLGGLLHGAHSDDERTEITLALTRLAVGHLLDALEPYVSLEDRAIRYTLFDVDVLDTEMEQSNCA